MATYRTAPNLGKPPAPETLSKRHRRMSKQGAAALREASAGRKYGTKADLERQAREEARRTAVHPGPHLLPVEPVKIGRLDEKGRLVETGLVGGAKTLVAWVLTETPELIVRAARSSREVEVRIGTYRYADVAEVVARVVFRDGRLVHAFAHVNGHMVKRTLTALKLDLYTAVAS